jgi:hypothetical protein
MHSTSTLDYSTLESDVCRETDAKDVLGCRMSPDHARQRIHPIFWAICARAYAICVNLLRRRHDSRPDCRLPFLNSRPVSQLESELIRSIQGQRLRTSDLQT